MPCNNTTLNGAAGTNARFQVTQDNGETLWGHLSDFDSASGLQTKRNFKGAALRDGTAVFPLVAGHTYIFMIVKMPSTGTIQVQSTVPNNVLPPCNETGRFIGPWFINA